MREFFTGLAPWVFAISVIAIVAIIYGVISYRRNRKLRKGEIEWKIGKETDQVLDYNALIDFFERYSSLGGRSEQDQFLKYASNTFKKQIVKSEFFSDLEGIFSGFRSDSACVNAMHKMVKKENYEKVLLITEKEWKERISNKLTTESLNDFQKRLKADWGREYELSEIFYERIKAEREKLEKKN